MGRKPEKTTRSEFFLLVVGLCSKISYDKITQKIIAAETGLSTSLVSYYFHNMDNLKSEIMTYAIDQELVHIVSEGLAMKNIFALDCSQELKDKCAEYLRGL